MAEGVIYLDHAATSRPKPEPVIEAMVLALREFGSPGRGAHRVGVETSRAIFETRGACAAFLGVEDPRDLLFQPGCTAAVNLMLKGLLRPGDRVVVSPMEHNSVSRPLSLLRAQGVEVVMVGADATGSVDADEVEAVVRATRTRAVVCQHVSNVTGTIQPIADLTDIAHEVGALMLVDGAQAGGHFRLDLGRLGADAYALSGHKGLLGPQGIGLLYLAPGIEATELIQGGTGSRSESQEQPTDRPSRYESGTPNTPGIVGLGAAVGYLTGETGEEVREREETLTRRLIEGFGSLSGVRILGPLADAPRAPIVSIVHETVDADRIAFRLDRTDGIAVRSGLHCAPGAHRTVGTLETGAVRFSVGWDTTEDDVDAAIAAMGGLPA